jgi:hypothetical protein
MTENVKHNTHIMGLGLLHYTSGEFTLAIRLPSKGLQDFREDEAMD